MANTFLGGTLVFKIDGQQYRLGGSISYSTGGLIRTAKNGPDGTLGYTTAYKEPMIDCELISDGSVTQQQLRAIDTSTITAELDNGITFVLINAWQEGDVTTNVVDAKMSIKFCAQSAQEIGA